MAIATGCLKLRRPSARRSATTSLTQHGLCGHQLQPNESPPLSLGGFEQMLRDLCI